ncbi:glycoside hydrolase family 27 protein [Mangrovibacterium diazotrophicum]|uniref:Alpha-galactosidase n=1 Tax=Mangrovibacterium diazotrophicum TaxID=1261403 RepID=A0A419W588_9BACT|nr:glycoside hydrolase family 27 protein [Mangrovibacterium diazotrophicum]RKD90629.1 alpha galactosidase A [Mangrovibacterium diazotrophicum]
MKKLKYRSLFTAAVLLLSPFVNNSSANNPDVNTLPGGTNSDTIRTAKPPIMGWSSWNNFRVNIDEEMIKEQADAMISSGLYDAGYRFINIDDGYFGGRDSTGKLFVDRAKFPSGMKLLVDYIHGLGLKAGIYTDAGRNTCGSIWDHDKNGIGVGIYGHWEDDCDLFFYKWGYDFLKVDWCGGEKMQLDEQTEYTKIIDAVKAVDRAIVFNICRWQFPGVWAIHKADSWRISGDIQANFSSILHIIDLNVDLAKYASAGHYNDMDMLQVGRGMTYEEDKTHFSMWCMLNSPLLAGNDLRDMSEETIEILTNTEIIALNQDPGFKQATRVLTEGSIEVWVKPVGEAGDSKAIAIMNRGEDAVDFELNTGDFGIDKNATFRDLWKHEDLGMIEDGMEFSIPEHGIVVLKVK